MKSTEYLYNILPSLIANEPYKVALQIKLECAIRLYTFLEIEADTLTTKEYFDNIALRRRIHDVNKAIEFNENLLKELDD